jgi:hypothetical protein
VGDRALEEPHDYAKRAGELFFGKDRLREVEEEIEAQRRR